MTIGLLSTTRILLREPDWGDADFVLRLLNDPDWLRFIGDRGVRTPEDARRYIDERLLQSFKAHGFGLWVVALRDSGRAIGLCGLLRRASHPDVEIGFAFLPEARGLGLAAEAAQLALTYAERNLELNRLVALTLPDNTPSASLLRKLGLSFERGVIFEGETDLVHVYAMTLPRTTS